MGLRSRLREGVSSLLGRGAAPAVPSAAPPAPPRPVARTAMAEQPIAKAAAPPPANLSPEEKAKLEKVAAHQEKARKGLLKWLVEQGGTTNMADMHDYSERRYFIAHQGFSRLMEGFVADGLVDYDARSGGITITEKAREFVGTGA